MIIQYIKATILFIAVILTILGIAEYNYDVKSYLGFIGSAFTLVLLYNIVDLFDKWHSERRKFELPTEDKLPYMWRRQAD